MTRSSARALRKKDKESSVDTEYQSILGDDKADDADDNTFEKHSADEA